MFLCRANHVLRRLRSPTKLFFSTNGNAVVEVNSSNYEDVVLKSKQPVIMQAYANWCRPCRNFSPIVEAEVKKHDGKVLLAKLDTDENGTIAQSLEVKMLPTLYSFHAGKVYEQSVGSKSAEEVQTFIQNVLMLNA
eukprot:g2481.t1